jgi:hypothetical protein
MEEMLKSCASASRSWNRVLLNGLAARVMGKEMKPASSGWLGTAAAVASPVSAAPTNNLEIIVKVVDAVLGGYAWREIDGVDAGGGRANV